MTTGMLDILKTRGQPGQNRFALFELLVILLVRFPAEQKAILCARKKILYTAVRNNL
jgi:hypothetical protein